MDEFLRFGYGPQSYIFAADSEISLQGNFGDSKPKSSAILGMDGAAYLGGFDRVGSGAGNVQGYFWLFADSASEMADLREAAYAMLDWGPKHLIKRHMNGQQVWTWGSVTNIEMAMSAKNMPHRRQQMQINFHCPKARWYGKGQELYGQPESLFLDGMPAFTPKVDRTDVGNGDTVSITNNGNATAGAYIRWEAPVGVTIENPKLQRLNEFGLVADEVEYSDTLSPGDVVDIQGRNHLLFNNYSVTPSYDKLSILHGGWLEIPPGTWEIAVSGTFTGGDGKLTIDCWDTYR
jgi:hypothetical protein